MAATLLAVSAWDYEFHPEVWLLIAAIIGLGVYSVRSIGPLVVPAGEPVVTIAQKGLTDTVCQEIDRALNDHELIKISIKANTRQQRQTTLTAVCELSGAELIQAIGHVALLLRRSDKPDPRLSNLIRPL